MGMTLWIHTLEGRKISKESADHSVTYRFSDKLDAIAQGLGVMKLNAFFDDTDLKANAAAEFEDEIEDEEKPLDPETGWSYGIDAMRWHSAAEGLKTLKALRTHLAAAEPTIGGKDAKQLLQEIDDCLCVLRAPASRGAKFHLAIVF